MSERTLIIIKPDAIQRRLTGQIISRFESKGIKIVGCKFMQITRQLAERHYAEHQGKPFYKSLLEYVTSGPVLVIALQARDIIAMSRKMIGKTFCSQAEPGTIRGDLGYSNSYNLVHGSDSPESAQRELALFFAENELIDYELSNNQWLDGRGD